MSYQALRSVCAGCGVERTSFRVPGGIREGPCPCTIGQAEWERRQQAAAADREREKTAKAEGELAQKRARKREVLAVACWEASGRFCLRHPEDRFSACAACPGGR